MLSQWLKGPGGVVRTGRRRQQLVRRRHVGPTSARCDALSSTSLKINNRGNPRARFLRTEWVNKFGSDYCPRDGTQLKNMKLVNT